MARVFAALSEVVRMVETGALEIRTPDDNDPALVTAIQLDGDIVCSIYPRRLSMLVGAGETLDGLAARHRATTAERLGAMTAKAALLSHPVALLISVGVWGVGGGGFAFAFDMRTYVWSVLAVPLLHWGVRQSPRFAVRLALPIIRRRIAREMRAAA
ncbi:MAG: hypothetical protein ABSC95_30150 [Acetobacteraceae bacterium]|jgi:hypothetical protein